jgi:sulfonate transport system substrate-binding protein
MITRGAFVVFAGRFGGKKQRGSKEGQRIARFASVPLPRDSGGGQGGGIARVMTVLIATLAVVGIAHAAPLPKEVRIGVISSYVNGKPLASGASNVVVSQGYLESQLQRQGVKLVWVPIAETNVGPLINEAFASKRIDFASYGDLPAIILNAGGVQTRVVVPSGRGGDAYLVVPANSSAHSIQDLKGKRVAVHRGRPWELPFVKLLAANGLSYKDFRIINTNPHAGSAALVAGEVDAVVAMNNAYLLEEQKVGRILWSTKEAPLDWKYRYELWGAREFIEQYPEITQIVATAHVKAQHWSSLEENRDEVIRRVALAGTPEHIARRNYEDASLTWKQRWSASPDEVMYAHYRAATQFCLDQKLIRRPVSADALIEPRFVRTALRQLGLEDFWDVGSARSANFTSQPLQQPQRTARASAP